jgi:hypothetical protein
VLVILASGLSASGSTSAPCISGADPDLWLAVETLRRLVGELPLFEFLARMASGPDTVTRE